MKHKKPKHFLIGDKVIITKVKEVVNIEKIKNKFEDCFLFTFSDGSCQVYDEKELVAYEVKPEDNY